MPDERPPLLCRWGFHRRNFHTTWEPSIYAPIVTRALTVEYCCRCRREIILHDWRYDPETGAPLQVV